MPKGEQHYAWKGEGAGYKAFHLRVLRARGAARMCENREAVGCVSNKYEWAHIRGTDPGDPANYRALCKTCHQSYDKQTGADHANAKLTMAQVAEIRERYAASRISQEVLAAEYGVSQGVISGIVRGKSYKSADGSAADTSVKQHRERVAQDSSASVTFGALRRRVYRARGPASRCVNRETAACANEHYEWALTPDADAGDMENWVQLCASCRVSVHGHHGAGNARAKLRQEDADTIRARYAAGGVTYRELAAEYGVTMATISNIVLHRRYAPQS